MPTLPSQSSLPAPHEARDVAQSFGVDAARYDRTRPRYPDALIGRIIDAIPGLDVVDVGIGTGVSARPFRAAGFRVLGVEVDPRMAAAARRAGFEVEVARFEEWDRAGRTFDAIVAGMTWHWVDPAAGAARAAQALRPGGRFAAFWNIGRPPAELAAAFSDVYRRVWPGTPFGAAPRDPLGAYGRFFAATSDEIRGTGAFGEPERWRVDWERSYTTAEWLDQVPTFGGHSLLSADRLAELLGALGAAVDARGGGFVMSYAAVAVTASKRA